MTTVEKIFLLDPVKTNVATWLKKHFEVLKVAAKIEVELELKEIFLSIDRPKDFKIGDYALPAFKWAKKFDMQPMIFLEKLVQLMEQDRAAFPHQQIVERFETKGPFLNFFLELNQFSTYLLDAINEEKWSEQFKKATQLSGEVVMIEYSQPNTHKEFHVGHARNVCLGNSIHRLFKFSGLKTYGVNYIGDEGAHIAKCLWGIYRDNADQADFLALKNADDKSKWLGSMYQKAHAELSDAPAEQKEKIQKEISEILKGIESKKGKYYDDWIFTRQYSLQDFNQIYAWLDVDFDHFFYESEVSLASQEIVDEYLKKGLFYYDNGAVGFDMSDAKLGFFMARKSDGTTLYITKDLALAKCKFEQYQINRSIYVVASEQNFHFKQLFHALEKMGFQDADKCFHLSYGMVVRPDGKMSSRAGNTFTFNQLREIINQELDQYLEKYRDTWDESEILETKKRLANGAIKYGMISTDPNKEIVFDPKEWTSFEGQSGPYLMYSYARSQSLLKKAEQQGLQPKLKSQHSFTSESEKELLRYLYEFNSTLDHTLTHSKPSTLAQYLFQLCKSYNRFYVEVPVLKSEDKDFAQTKLYLIRAFSLTLKEGLGLLGMTPPNRM